ncbi:MAG: hypothetical protein DMD91_02365 [Candidatus Rokuibacteriota bacterium]|nr:MAG: hypothetical protein DMD91_02365 [Candidatus Rokubacteria bacterium]
MLCHSIRRLLSVLVLALALCPLLALGQDGLAERKAAAERYMAVVPISRLLDDTYTEMAKQLPSDQQSAFIQMMKGAVRADVIERIALEAMLKTFTAEELNALADFYGSKNGYSAMRKFGSYMALVTPALQQEVQRALQQIQKK